jgi:CHAT domain-containing protein
MVNSFGVFSFLLKGKLRYPKITSKCVLESIYSFFIILGLGNSISSQSSLAFQADSLSYCGYFKQEIELRKKILLTNYTDTLGKEINSVLLKIALYNEGDDSLDDKDWERMYEDIVHTYLMSSDKVKAKTALEVGRLMALRAIGEGRVDDGLNLMHALVKCYSVNSTSSASLYLNIAQTMHNVEEKYFESIPYFQKAVAGFEACGYGNHYITALAYNDLGYAYSTCGVQKEVLPNYEKATEIWTKHYPFDFEMNITAYNNAIEAAIDYGDKSKAAQHDSALRIYFKFSEAKSNDKKRQVNSAAAIFDAKALYHLSSIRYNAFNFNEGQIKASLADQELLFANASANHRDASLNKLLSSYDNACGAFYTNEKYEQALIYNDNIENIANSGFYAMKSAANQALIYYYSGRGALSLDYTGQALQKIKQNPKSLSFLTLTTLKAENLAMIGCYDEALGILDSMYAGYFGRPISIDSIKLVDFGTSNNDGLINVLVHTGLTFKTKYLQDGHQPEDLNKTIKIYSLAADLFEAYYQKGIFNPSLDRMLTSIKGGLLFTCRYAGGDQEHLIDVINKIENISSQHLWKQFISKYSKNLNSDIDLLSRRNIISIELTYLNMITEKDSIQSAKEDSLQTLVTEIDDRIAKENPKYITFQEKNFNLRELQLSLGSKQTLVRYYTTDSMVYACKINEKSIQLFNLGKSDSLNIWVKRYYKQITNIDFNYAENANELYQILIQPLGMRNGQNVVIIPEKNLSLCSFESLLDEGGRPFGLTHTVSYAHSLKFVSSLEKGRFKKRSQSRFNSFLSGFAPTYKSDNKGNRGQIGTLLFNEEEVNAIASIYKQSQVYNADKATKANFIQSLGTTNIHHLAMHSIADTFDYEQSSLIFDKGEKLYFYELYALNFPSELVVLSACNTGFGQYLDGEGMMSLSRALCYAGAKASINSLWQVSDKETSNLMMNFYQYLKQGYPKDESLALAKQQFLKENPMKTHPFYWSAFVVNGDISPVSSSSNFLYFFLGGLTILGLLGLVFYHGKTGSKLVK